MAIVSESKTKQHVSSAPGICGGKPCIAGTRIRVWDVGSLAQTGHSPDEILAHYPSLTLADIHAALAYYYDNRQQIDAEIAEGEKFVEMLHKKLGPGPLEQKLMEENKAVGP
ncbi:MAG TPA: DUF433 domain-containing protein [Humisphaera sp.]|nr:DUF433 domain-containing protein [Humisphaera sp.]